MLALVLNCIDRLNIYNSVAHFAGIAREESGMAWKEILRLLYKLLGKHTPGASPWEDFQGCLCKIADPASLLGHLLLTG